MMRKLLGMAAALVFASALAMPAAAAETDVSEDVICLAIFLVATGASEEQESRMASVASTMYLAGLIEGKTGRNALDLVEPVLKSLTLAQIERHGASCGDRMTAMGEEWVKRGKAMERAAEAGERGT